MGLIRYNKNVKIYLEGYEKPLVLRLLVLLFLFLLTLLI
jgi:hypothetical protein